MQSRKDGRRFDWNSGVKFRCEYLSEGSLESRLKNIVGYLLKKGTILFARYYLATHGGGHVHK